MQQNISQIDAGMSNLLSFPAKNFLFFNLKRE